MVSNCLFLDTLTSTCFYCADNYYLNSLGFCVNDCVLLDRINLFTNKCESPDVSS